MYKREETTHKVVRKSTKETLLKGTQSECKAFVKGVQYCDIENFKTNTWDDCKVVKL